MKILVSMGSFKDVFSPIETTKIVADALDKHEVKSIPMCDGGEYTYDIVKYHNPEKCSEIIVNDVINPYGNKVVSKYLIMDDTAYIVSSEIIRLAPKEDQYKNPLMLTDYGLGQLCKDAINRGYKNINLCLGGTSTVGFGMGFAQAMGAKFIDVNGESITKPITPKMMSKVDKIIPSYFGDVVFTIINDGVTRAQDLSDVNPQKIGHYYDSEKQNILSELDKTLIDVCRLTGVSIDTPFAGNAGGVCFGIEMVTKGNYVKGTDFFMDLFGVERILNQVDLVITGEGKLDNPHTEKLPVSISLKAKKNGKKCLFICGQRDELATDQVVHEYGIEDVICCRDYYAEIDSSFIDSIDYYRKLAPLVIGKELNRRYG